MQTQCFKTANLQASRNLERSGVSPLGKSSGDTHVTRKVFRFVLFTSERRMSIWAVPAQGMNQQYRSFIVDWLWKELSGGGQAP